MPDTLTGVIEEDGVTPPNDEEINNASYLEQLVGDGKKYRDPEALAKAYLNASLHINELKDKLDDAASQKELVEEVVKQLRSKPNDDGQPEPNPGTPAEARAQINEDDVAKLVQRQIEQTKQVETAKGNMRKSFDLILAHYNGNRVEMQKAVEAAHKNNPGVKAALDKLAETDPEAAFRFVTGASPKPTAAPNAPGVSGPSAAALVASTGRLTWSQARELKKKDPKAYNSPTFRKKMEAEVARYQSEGKDFFAT